MVNLISIWVWFQSTFLPVLSVPGLVEGADVTSESRGGRGQSRVCRGHGSEADRPLTGLDIASTNREPDGIFVVLMLLDLENLTSGIR